MKQENLLNDSNLNPTEEMISSEAYIDVIREELSTDHLENTRFIGGNSLLPKEFPQGLPIKSLGEVTGIKLRPEEFEFEVIFEGGTVLYNRDEKISNSYLPSMIILFAATVEPGVRSMGTSGLDTHILFDYFTKEEAKNGIPRSRDEIDAELYSMVTEELTNMDGLVMRTTVLQPEADIKEWWNR